MFGFDLRQGQVLFGYVSPQARAAWDVSSDLDWDGCSGQPAEQDGAMICAIREGR